MHVHLTLKSNNQKTGPIPVSTTSADTCPDSCPFKGNGCYAEYGPLKLHWDRVTRGQRGMPWRDFLAAVRALPDGQLWRHNQAGDLPGEGDKLDARQLRELTRANTGKRGFTYTHKPMNRRNWQLIKEANQAGFTVNVSANSLAEAARTLTAWPGIPVVAVVPEDSPSKGYVTEDRRFVVCPAQDRDDVSCETCGLCQNTHEHRPVIAFRAHGTGKRAIHSILQGA